MNNILIVVDYQKDFVSGALGFEAAQALETGIAQRVETALAQGWKVLFTRDTHQPDYLESREGRYLPVPHCLQGSEGWQLEGILHRYETAPVDGVAFVDKPTFGSAGLPQAVQDLCGGEPGEIQLCGVVTNICVVSNAILLHSFFLNSEISIVSSLCAAPNPQDHQRALDLLAGMGYKIL